MKERKSTHLVRYEEGFHKRKKEKQTKDTASSGEKLSQEQEEKTEIINVAETSSSLSLSELWDM